MTSEDCKLSSSDEEDNPEIVRDAGGNPGDQVRQWAYIYTYMYIHIIYIYKKYICIYFLYLPSKPI